MSKQKIDKTEVIVPIDGSFAKALLDSDKPLTERTKAIIEIELEERKQRREEKHNRTMRSATIIIALASMIQAIMYFRNFKVNEQYPMEDIIVFTAIGFIIIIICIQLQKMLENWLY